MSDVDPELREWLAEARDTEAAPPAELGALFADVEARIARAEEEPGFWLRTRSTFARRAIAGVVIAAFVAVGGALLAQRELGADAAVAASLLAVLLGLSVHHALRPLHRPPLATWARALVVVLSLGATFAIAILPPGPGGHAGGEHLVSPCLFYGLMVGVPVYLVLRLLDRGTSAAPLLGACAAGLAGNLVLSLHCPSHDLEHLMLGHFSVALLFVAGLGLVHVLLRARGR